MISPRLLIKAAAPIASLFLILAGIMQLRAQTWISGGLFVILAMLGFVFSVRLLEKAPLAGEEIESLRPWMLQTTLWVAASSLLLISIFYVADDFNSTETNRIAAVAWVSSVLLGMVATWRSAFHLSIRRVVLEKVRANRIEFILLLIVITIAFSVRTFDLLGHPYPWSGDEASIGTEAMRILSGEITNFFETGWSSQPNWSFLPTAISEVLLGKNILAVRLPSALAGVLAVLFVYLAAREFFNPVIALMAGAFLATLPYNVHFSRIGVHNVMDSLMSALMFWLIARAMKTDDPRYYYSAGAVGGLCIYTYAGTRLALILGGVAILFLIVRQKNFLVLHWKHLTAFSASIVISAAPQAAFFARHTDIFIGRLGQEGILFNGWLSQQAAQTGKSVLDILLNQFTRTMMVFIASAAPGNFFNSPIPYLTVLGSIFFLLGMAFALAFGLEPRYFILLCWFWAAILLGGVLTMNPPANTRLLMTSPPVAMFMALGVYRVVEYLQKLRLLSARLVIPILGLVVGVITYQHINFYMGEYREHIYFQDPNGEFAMEVALMANDRGRDFQIYVLGAPRIFANFPTFAFVAPDNFRIDLSSEGIPVLQLPADGDIGFFAIPENRTLLQEIIQKYPGGESGLAFRRPNSQEVLFEYYILRR